MAWNALLKARSTERDLRVLEAMKVGEVSVFDSFHTRQLANAPTCVITRFCGRKVCM